MSRTVLLLEDEPNIIEALSFILTRAGWRVFAHSDGATAVDCVKQHNPDLVILDVMLPNLSGFDILSALRKGEFAELPILMLTAKGQQKDREVAEGFGVSEFMTKPFANAEILAVADRLVPTVKN